MEYKFPKTPADLVSFDQVKTEIEEKILEVLTELFSRDPHLEYWQVVRKTDSEDLFINASYWSWCHGEVDNESERFPIEYIYMDRDEYVADYYRRKEEERLLLEQERLKALEKEKGRKEERERAEYERLKAKYGGS